MDLLREVFLLDGGELSIGHLDLPLGYLRSSNLAGTSKPASVVVAAIS